MAYRQSFGAGANARSSLVPTAAGRLKQMREAKEMGKSVRRQADRIGVPLPPYDFLELIGKGAYGKVFKSRSHGDRSTVAIKILDIDNDDYRLEKEHKDQAIKDFTNEINILHTLKDAGAKNINIIHDAFAFFGGLWIVSEYCPGGAVKTCMKASPQSGLEEKYIRVIARELAIALKCVHDAGILHRDIKAANVLILEDGRLQLCDFGVSGVLESSVAKRSTIIGTPNWMSPEMLDQSPGARYGTEIDCWAFGCTMYELATGQPPYAGLPVPQLIYAFKKAPRLEEEKYSQALREFVSFCLEIDPHKRPSAKDILGHNYVRNTAESYPTAMLKELIDRFKQWEQAGGQRQSLFNPLLGAGGSTIPDPVAEDDDDEWNFSATDDADLDALQEAGVAPFDVELEDNKVFEATPAMTSYERAQMETKALRGRVKMNRLFDPDAPAYESSSQFESDLPLRRDGDSDVRESIIDLDEAMESDEMSIDLGNIPTIKAGARKPAFRLDDDDNMEEEGEPQYEAMPAGDKRATMQWTFPSSTMPAPANRKTLDWTFPGSTMDTRENDDLIFDDPPHDSFEPIRNEPVRPSLRHMTTEPVGQFGDHFHSTSQSFSIDLDDAGRLSVINLDEADPSTLLHSREPSTNSAPEYFTTEHFPERIDDELRPTTSYSSAAESEFSSSNPFTLGHLTATAEQRGSLHGHSFSEPKSYRSSGNHYEHDEERRALQNLHNRGSSWSNDGDSGLSRAPSVKASMDSLRSSRDDDDDYSPEATVHRPPIASGLWDATGREMRQSTAPVELDTGTMKRAYSVTQRRDFDQTARPRGRRGRARARESGESYEGLERMPNFTRTQLYPRPEAPAAPAFEPDASTDVLIGEVKKMLLGMGGPSGEMFLT